MTPMTTPDTNAARDLPERWTDCHYYAGGDGRDYADAECGNGGRWLFRRHPDGQWVTFGKMTHAKSCPPTPYQTPDGETTQILADPNLMAQLAASEADVKAVRVRSHEDVKRELDVEIKHKSEYIFVLEASEKKCAEERDEARSELARVQGELAELSAKKKTRILRGYCPFCNTKSEPMPDDEAVSVWGRDHVSKCEQHPTHCLRQQLATVTAEAERKDDESRKLCTEICLKLGNAQAEVIGLKTKYAALVAELRPLVELAGKATPGEWSVDGDSAEISVWCGGFLSIDFYEDDKEANAAFVAAARNFFAKIAGMIGGGE